MSDQKPDGNRGKEAREHIRGPLADNLTFIIKGIGARKCQVIPNINPNRNNKKYNNPN